MKRREFVEKLGIGSAGIAAAAALTGTRVNAAAAKQHDHGAETDGPLSQATVSFGQWKLPLNRFTAAPAPTDNNHHLMPFIATIKAGGAVNFLISGLHNVLVYEPGTTVEELQAIVAADPKNENGTVNPVAAGFGGFVDIPANRLYRGLNPVGLTPDRVEAVT